MRRGIMIWMALLLIFGCAVAEQTSFDPVHISLWGEPASGYEWSCAFEGNEVLNAPLMEYVEGTDGVSGTGYDFYFGVRGPGCVHLSFNYGPAWGIAPAVRTALCSVTVNADGSHRLYWAECFTDDRLLEVRLPSNPSAGWSWSYAGDSAGQVTLLAEDYSPYFEDLPGAGGVDSYEFHLDAPGETLLLFNYANIWDPLAAAEESYVLHLMVSEEMEVSMFVDDGVDELFFRGDEAE